MALPIPSGVALAIIVGSIVFSTASAFLSTAQQKQSYERLHPHSLVKKGQGTVSAIVSTTDRTGEKREIIAGKNDSNIMKIIASEPVRPGTVTRIDIHHPYVPFRPLGEGSTINSFSSSDTMVELEGILGQESW